MDKGGTQTPDTVLELCARMKKYGIAVFGSYFHSGVFLGTRFMPA